MELINGAQACNVFWQVGSSATLGTNSTFVGSIMALQSITANTGAEVDGRLLARNGAVTLQSNVIEKPTCLVPSIVIVKDGPSSANVGDTITITYTYTVNNSGGLTLNNVQVVDDLLGNITLADTTLDPGESTVGTQDYTVQASDLPGPIVNTATATGDSGMGDTVTVTDSAIVAISGTGPSILIVKEASPTEAEIGDIITYTYTVTNTGGVTITASVYDDRLGNITLNDSSLDAGESTVGVGQYTVQPSDLPGPIVNNATATGNDGAVDVNDTDDASVDTN